MRSVILSLSLLTLCISTSLAADREVRRIDHFEAGLGPQWEEKIFHGVTNYQVVNERGGKVLQARSQSAASGLISKQKYRLQDYPILSWRWRVKGIIPTANETQKSGDDYAARVYVVFPHWFFPKTRTISYVWANRLPQGASLPSPYTGNAQIIAVESGEEKVGTWLTESRNVLEDYRRVFGEEPGEVGAIAIMTDTDNTGSSAEAWYDDLQIEKP